jgi:hypothetical protein
MDRNACPRCKASLDDDALATTGVAECPFCGEPLPERASEVTPEIAQAPAAGQMENAAAATDLPAGSGVRVVEADEARQVIHIPPGGKQTRSLGVFALVWNGIMAAFTGMWISSGDEAPWILLVLFLGLFWGVGLFMLVFWIRMRFTRTYLLLERDRIAIQRTLFGRKSIAETLLGPDSKAELVQSYSSNDRPVYSIVINGTNRTAKFGTALSREEKLWFVATINSFLRVAGIVPAAGEPSSSKRVVFDDLLPEDLSTNSAVTVHAGKRDRLSFSLPAVPSGKVRTLLALFASGFALLWIGTTSRTALAAFGNEMDVIDWVAVLMPGVMTLAGVVPLSVAAFAVLGRTAIEVTPETLRCRWGIGKIGYGVTWSTPQITHVMVAVPMAEKYARDESRRVPQSSDVKVCMVFAGTKMIPLTTFHDLQTAREVAGLTRGQLHGMGFALQDE